MSEGGNHPVSASAGEPAVAQLQALRRSAKVLRTTGRLSARDAQPVRREIATPLKMLRRPPN